VALRFEGALEPLPQAASAGMMASSTASGADRRWRLRKEIAMD
jgi:hypothetical protein